MYLFIHAPDREHTFFLLARNGKISARSKPKFRDGKMADLLKYVHALLSKQSVFPSQLKGVVVLSGPGQFSFLRSGIIIANTFAWALRIPVVGIYGDEFETEVEFVERGLKKLARTPKKITAVLPLYGKEPNITRPKKKI